MDQIYFFSLPTFKDSRGALTSIELEHQVFFTPKRLYYLTDTKEKRGGHAHKTEQEVFVCVKGTFTAKVHDGKNWHTYEMKPGDALFNSEMVWHEFDHFSPDAVMLAISSEPYDKDRKGYIMDFEEFEKAF